MNKKVVGNQIDIEIKALEKRISKNEEIHTKCYNALQNVERMLAKDKKQLENLKMMQKCVEDYEEIVVRKIEKKPKEEPKEQSKECEVTKGVELTFTTKNPRVGKFDMMGNQLGLWLSQGRAAKELGITQSGLSYIMKTSKEAQIKKRGYYFAWVH